MQQPAQAWATTLRDAMRAAEAEANAEFRARMASNDAQVRSLLESGNPDDTLAAIAILETACVERAQRIVSEVRRLVSAVPLNRKHRRGLMAAADALCAKVMRCALDQLGNLTLAEFKPRFDGGRREIAAIDRLWTDLLTEALETPE